MALNFPTDTTQPYFDPVSGLKYIYNSSIGAWETAIQPPAVIFPSEPTINIPGFLWWDPANDERRLKIWVEENGAGQWLDATPTPPPATIDLGDEPPTPITHPDLEAGDLWWDNVSGRLYIYYKDADSSQWVDASPVPDNGARGNSYITQGENPPSDPEPNDMWFDTVSGNLFIWYTDDDSSQWVITQNISGQVAYVDSIRTTGPLSVSGDKNKPLLSIAEASTTDAGITKIATLAEAAAGTATDVVLTPGILKAAIDSYVTAAAPTVAAASSDDYDGNPCGTIITFANQNAPTGYLKCDGSQVSRNTYSSLFAVIGTTFGFGNGASTFTLPTLTHDNPLIIHCIKV